MSTAMIHHKIHGYDLRKEVAQVVFVYFLKYLYSIKPQNLFQVVNQIKEQPLMISEAVQVKDSEQSKDKK